jgi:hypothetical protein
MTALLLLDVQGGESPGKLFFYMDLLGLESHTWQKLLQPKQTQHFSGTFYFSHGTVVSRKVIHP